MTYGDYKDLVGIKTSDKVLHDKAFEIVTNLQSNRFQRELAFLVWKILNKKDVVKKK